LADTINLAILIGAGLVALSTLTSLVSQRIGAPLLLIFLAVGLLAGEDGLLGIDFDNGPVAYFIGSVALAIILFDSGFDTPLRSYRVAAWPALTLATIGVILTAAIVGAAAHYLFGIGWIEGMLLGSIVASTDAAAVFFLLRVGGLNLRERVRATLEIESGANDPMAIFLTTVLVDLASSRTDPNFGLSLNFAAAFAEQIGLGVIVGVIGGLLIATLLNGFKTLDAGLYPITCLASALVVFAAGGLLGGSGFLAAYVAGVVCGSRKVAFAQRIRRFQTGMTWIAQIGMFLTLGLLATPSEFGAVIGPAIALAVILIFVARPLAVWLCLLPFGFKWREHLFVGWVGLRGAVSILLAILPWIGGVEGGRDFFNIVFIMVIASLIVQGWTIAVAANLLNMNAPTGSALVDRIEFELPGGAELELIGYRLHPESAVAGGARIPRWARPVLIHREGAAYSVHNSGPLRGEDRVYLFGSPRQIPALDAIYASPGETVSAAAYGDFSFSGTARLKDIADQYDLPASWRDDDKTVGEFLMREFSGKPIVGDRLSIGGSDLIVNALGDDGGVESVGIDIDPAVKKRRTAATVAADRLRALARRLRQMWGDVRKT